MKKQLPLALGLLFSFQIAYGSLGDQLPTYEIPDGVCRITFQTENESYHCSGVLVSKNAVKTAAHCINGHADVSVQCGQGTKAKVIEQIAMPGFNKKLLKREPFNRRTDIAIFALDQSIDALPLEMVNSRPDINQLIQNAESCAFFGVGLNPYSKGTGRLHGASFLPSVIENDRDVLIANAPFSAVTMIGDSGSGVLCRQANGPWKVIGTISAHGWDNETYIAPNFFAEDFLNSYSNHRVDNDQELKVREEETINNRKATYLAQCQEELQQISDESSTKDLESCQKTLTAAKKSSFEGKQVLVKPFSWYQILAGEVDGEANFNTADRKIVRMDVKKIEGDYAIGDLTFDSTAEYYLCEGQHLCEESISNVKVQIDRLQLSQTIPSFIDFK